MNDKLEKESAAGEFAVKLSVLLDNGRTDDALDMLYDDSNESLMNDACLELFSVIGERTSNGNLLKSHPDFQEYVQSMLEHLTKSCKPKEVLIALLDLFERMADDFMFHLLCSLLKITFIRLPNRRNSDFSWTLLSIIRFIYSLPSPPPHQLDEKELVLQENCTISRQSEQCLTTALNFCDLFVSETRTCSIVDRIGARNSTKSSLGCFLLLLINQPIADFDARHLKRIGFRTVFFDYINRTINLLLILFPSSMFIHDAVQHGQLSTVCTEESLSVEIASLAVLDYLILVEGYGSDSQPCVYSPQFLFDTCTSGCVQIFRSSRSPVVVCKAVDLFDRLLHFIELGVWSKEKLGSLLYQEIGFGLLNIMHNCSLWSIRNRSLVLFKSFMDRFDEHGQLSMIRLMFSIYDAPNCSFEPSEILPNLPCPFGFLAQLVDYFRFHLHQSCSAYFQEARSILPIFCHLPESQSTDILSRKELYLASLNLIFYLTMNPNRFEFSTDILEALNDQFIQPLGKAINSSISICKFQLESMENFKTDEDKNPQNNSMINTGEENAGNSLISLDLMLYLLSIVQERLVFISGEQNK